MSDAPTRSPRALRIGLFLGDKRLEERVLRRRETVTIGPDARCTFIVPPVSGLPPRFALFQVGDHGYTLCLSEGMRGKLTQGGETERIAELLRDGMPERDGYVRVAVDDSALGELRLGELKVLFQFVKPPPLQPRPVLPLSLRPSLRDLIERDKRVWAIALASFVCHFAFVVYLRAMEKPKTPDIEEIPDRFVRMLVPKKIEPKKLALLPKPDAKKPADAKPQDPTPPVAAEATADVSHIYATTVRKRGVTKAVLTPEAAANEIVHAQGRSLPPKSFLTSKKSCCACCTVLRVSMPGTLALAAANALAVFTSSSLAAALTDRLL